MGKKWFIILITIGIMLAIVLGIYAYNKGSILDTNMIQDKKLAKEEKEEVELEQLNQAISTLSISENISPNAIIIEKRYYKGCDHLIREVVDIPEKLVNKTKNDVQKEYSDWAIERYSNNEIILYKEFTGLLIIL